MKHAFNIALQCTCGCLVAQGFSKQPLRSPHISEASFLAPSLPYELLRHRPCQLHKQLASASWRVKGPHGHVYFPFGLRTLYHISPVVGISTILLFFTASTESHIYLMVTIQKYLSPCTGRSCLEHMALTVALNNIRV